MLFQETTLPWGRLVWPNHLFCQSVGNSSPTCLSLLCCSLTLISIWPLENNRSNKILGLAQQEWAIPDEGRRPQSAPISQIWQSVLSFLVKNTEKLSVSHAKLKFANFIIKSTIVNWQNTFCGLNFLNDTRWNLYKSSNNSILTMSSNVYF